MPDDVMRDEGSESAEEVPAELSSAGEPPVPPEPEIPSAPPVPPAGGPVPDQPASAQTWASEEPAAMTAPPPPPPPPPYAPPVEVMPTRPGPATESSKLLAALGYLFPIIAIIVLFIEPYKDEKFVRFHAVQALAVGVLYVVAGMIAWVPLIGWILWLVPLVLAIMGLVKAFQSEYWEMPIVYGLVKSFIRE
jgi:uncharacterized membrane protein